jgi:CRISPR-associated protein Cas1
MPIFDRPPLETLAMARDRWTPIYLEHGRLEVDDSSVKWISATGLLCRLPVATISAVLLGPGTTATHAAMKALFSGADHSPNTVAVEAAQGPLASLTP